MVVLENEKKPIALGPWGGPGGSSWDDFPYSSVKGIVIVHADGINSIQIEYDVNGTSVWSPKHGGGGGKLTDKIELDPNEYLIQINGHYNRMFWDWSGPVFIRSLSFRSNKKKYGPYGREEGSYFSIPTSGALIAGFFGTSGGYLDSIGIYLRPIEDQNYLNNNTVRTKINLGGGADNAIGCQVQVATECVGNNCDVSVAVSINKHHDSAMVNDTCSCSSCS